MIIKLIVAFCLALPTASLAAISDAPRAPLKPKRATLHGVSFIDDFAWLRNKEDPDTISYLKAQNRFADDYLSQNKALRKSVKEDILGRIPDILDSYPVVEREWAYYYRELPGKEHPELRRRPSLSPELPYKTSMPDSQDELVLDGNDLAKGSDYFEFTFPQPSPLHDLLAYGVDTAGDRKYEIRILDLKTKNHLPLRIPNTAGDFVWSEDNTTLIYTVRDQKSQRPFQVHRINVKTKEHAVLLEEANETFRLSVSISLTKRVIFLTSKSTDTTQTWAIPSAMPNATPKPMHARKAGLEAYFYDAGDRYFILNNEGGAKNFKISDCNKFNTDSSQWKTVWPANPNILIENLLVTDKTLGWIENKNAIQTVRLTSRAIKGALNASQVWNWTAPDPVYTVSFHGNTDYETQRVQLQYQSPRQPSSIYEIDSNTKVTDRRYVRPIKGNFDPDSVVVERFQFAARDKTLVPVTLIRKKTASWSKDRPVLMNAYGAYGSDLNVGFNQNRLTLLERGWAIAMVHVRGGSENGRQWYENGRKKNKKNTFNDFIDAALWLHKGKYTSPSYTFAYGASAGGLLIGAVINERPDLFKGVVADVPFVDVINTMVDPTLPLTTEEYSEWGHPSVAEDFRYMLSYSPYDQVTRQPYPAVFATGSLQDNAVGYWEPAKWVAKLRQMNTSDSPILLQTNMKAGHGGSSGRYEAVDEIADTYTFLISLLPPKQN